MNTKKLTKSYQFTVRLNPELVPVIKKRFMAVGYTGLAEYVRHLIIEDLNGREIIYGQKNTD